MTSFFLWWLVIQLFGLAALPIVRRVFRMLPDQGYAFSKTAGLLFVSYLLWLGAITGLWANDPGGIMMALLVTGGVSSWLLFSQGRKGWRERLWNFWNTHKRQILTTEMLFLACFAGWAIIRAFTPDKILPAGGEKYMEIAFLNGVLNSPNFPPLDPWLSGFGISYYYFGYVMMGVMTIFSGSVPTVGFDLYDALLFGLSAVSAFGVVGNLATVSGAARRAAQFTGLLGALLVVGIGNLEGLAEGLYATRALPERFWSWLNIPDLFGSATSGQFYPGHGWWWWRASRVIRDLDINGSPVVFQPIDEFPFFSFLLGDNHPHKLALPFVLLCIGLALALYLHKGKDTSGIDWWLYGSLALALGALGFLNTWDMPIYLALAALAYLFGTRQNGPFTGNILQQTVILSAILGVSAVLLYLFFYLGFSSQAGGILPYVFPPTRLAQFLVMFGPFVWALAVFFPLAARRGTGESFPWRTALRMWLWAAGLTMGIYVVALGVGALILSNAGASVLAPLQPWLGRLTITEVVARALGSRIANPWLFLLGSVLAALALTILLRADKIAPAAKFAVLMGLLGLGLALSVEFFYLRDNFGLRMNTVFKFYFQGWILMACASAYGIWWVAAHLRGFTRGLFRAVTAVVIAAALVYPAMATWSRVEGFRHKPTLDAAASVSGFYPGHWASQPDDWAAIEWMNQNVRPDGGNPPVILESPGGAYQNSNRVSAFTGLPTLLGWQNHEGQWRGSYEEQNRRLADIELIFTSPDDDLSLSLLREWNVRYVVLGDEERQFIERTCARPEATCSPVRALAKFDRILKPLFQQGSITVYAVP